MKARILKLLRFVWVLFVGYILGAVISMEVFSHIVNIPQMIKESHGFCGFLFGIIMIAGSVINQVIYWLITGKGIIDDL